MSYTKHEWVNNETITASKLNNIEDGIEEAAQSESGGYDLVFNVLHDDYSATLIKGNLDSIVAKAKAGKPISVYGITDYGDGFYYGMTIDRIEVDYSVVGDEYVRVRAAQSHFMSGGYVAAGSPCTIIFDANGIEGSSGWS